MMMTKNFSTMLKLQYNFYYDFQIFNILPWFFWFLLVFANTIAVLTGKLCKRLGILVLDGLLIYYQANKSYHFLPKPVQSDSPEHKLVVVL